MTLAAAVVYLVEFGTHTTVREQCVCPSKSAVARVKPAGWGLYERCGGGVHPDGHLLYVPRGRSAEWMSVTEVPVKGLKP